MKRPLHQTDRQLDENEPFFHITCVQCGNSFESKRYDASFCSGKCRVAHHRAIKAHELKMWAAMHDFKWLVSQASFSELKEMQQLIERKIDSVESKDTQYVCSECGQVRYIKPYKTDRCSFCQKVETYIPLKLG